MEYEPVTHAINRFNIIGTPRIHKFFTQVFDMRINKIITVGHVNFISPEVLYNRFCARCHELGRGVLPDLRSLSPGLHQSFYDIVLKGILAPVGMARWDDVLSRADAESIHAYIVDEAWKAYNAQTATAKSASSHE